MDISYYKEKYEPIDGKWYINKEIGRGSFGTVFEIERRDMPGIKAALKVISIPISQVEVNGYREENYDLDEESISSYFEEIVDEVKKEFLLMTQLKGNTNIVSVEDYDAVKKESEFGWNIFIRMELLTPMNKYFAENNPSQKDIIKLGIDICKALEVCQKYNIIHRDIKPSNIFVSNSGDYKLGDFGVARTLEKTSSGLSKKGTYTYMAPELFKGEASNATVDLYSLGIVMYKLLNNNMEPFRTERTFIDGEKALETRMRGHEKISAPSNCDGRLAEIILKACAFNAKERYVSPSQMRQDLENILDIEIDSKLIYSDDGDLNCEPSANSDSDEKTVSIFGNFTPQKENKKNNKTISVFDIDNKKEENNIISNSNINNNGNGAETKKKKKNVLHFVASGFFLLSLVAYVLYRWCIFPEFSEAVIKSALGFVMILPLVVAFIAKDSKYGKNCIIVCIILHLFSGIYTMMDSFNLISELDYGKSSMQVFVGNGILFIANLIFSLVVLLNLVKPEIKNKKINNFMWIVPVAFVLIRLVMFVTVDSVYLSEQEFVYIVRLVTMAIGYATATYSITKK